MKHSIKIPDNMQAHYKSIEKLTNSFCEKYLNEEYSQLAQYAIAALCRKRPTPLLYGKDNTWAASIMHALGTINFLFDKSHTPYISAVDLAKAFGLSTSTVGNKAKQVRELLKMHKFDHNWSLPSIIDNNSMIWMIMVNGFIVDARTLTPEIQEAAYKKGLIPYVHAYKTEKTG